LTISKFIPSLNRVMPRDETTVLRDHGINPSAQRVAVAQYVLHTVEHPSADEVWTRVRKRFPHVSRATVYNTLNLFVEKGLVRQFVLTEGRVVFDPKMEDHHHFIDEESGRIHDVPWAAVRVSKAPKLDGFEIREYQVVMRGRRTQRRGKS
jgi:Fur family transcriptional regulator, iron response regulator